MISAAEDVRETPRTAYGSSLLARMCAMRSRLLAERSAIREASSTCGWRRVWSLPARRTGPCHAESAKLLPRTTRPHPPAVTFVPAARHAPRAGLENDGLSRASLSAERDTRHPPVCTPPAVLSMHTEYAHHPATSATRPALNHPRASGEVGPTFVGKVVDGRCLACLQPRARRRQPDKAVGSVTQPALRSNFCLLVPVDT